MILVKVAIDPFLIKIVLKLLPQTIVLIFVRKWNDAFDIHRKYWEINFKKLRNFNFDFSYVAQKTFLFEVVLNDSFIRHNQNFFKLFLRNQKFHLF